MVEGYPFEKLLLYDKVAFFRSFEEQQELLGKVKEVLAAEVQEMDSNQVVGFIYQLGRVQLHWYTYKDLPIFDMLLSKVEAAWKSL